MNLFAVGNLSIGILCFVLGILTWAKGKKKPHYIWALFCFSVALWGFGGYKIATASSANLAIIWWKIAYAGVIFIPVFLVHFIYEFLEIKKRGLISASYLIGLIYLFLNFFSNQFINETRKVFDEFYYISPPTPLYSLFVIIFFGLVLFSHIILLRAYKKSQGIKKDQIRYIFISTTIGFLGGSFSFLPVYFIDFYPHPNIAIGLSPLIVFYAISRYRLMDIRIVARKTFIYFGNSAFTFGIFYLVAWGFNKSFGSIYSPSALVLGIIIAPLFILVFYITDKSLKSFANEFLFSSLNNYQDTIIKLSDNLNHHIDLDKISELIVDTIKKTMGLDKAGILMIDSDDNIARFGASKMVGFSEKNGQALIQDRSIISYLQKSQKNLVRDELSLLLNNAEAKKNKHTLNRILTLMENVEASLCLPLASNKQLIGIIILGAKNSKDAYTKEDLDLLTILSNQASTALQNARLYKEVEKQKEKLAQFNSKLKEKVDEQTKKIKEKNKYLEELLNIKNDFLRVVHHQLNTPLSVMKGYFSMMKDGSYTEEKAMPAIERGLERISSTVADFWDAYALEGERMKMEPQKTDVSEIINKLIPEKQKMQLAIERKLSITVKNPDKNLPFVWCDYKKVAHAISNLLDNAVYYTRKGEITVFYESEGDEFLKINFKDTGVGISEDDKIKMFQKFSRGDNATDLRPDGSGLGLFIAKKITEGNAGKLSFSSEGKEKGTTFCLALPIYKNQKLKKSDSKPISRKKIVIFN